MYSLCCFVLRGWVWVRMSKSLVHDTECRCYVFISNYSKTEPIRVLFIERLTLSVGINCYLGLLSWSLFILFFLFLLQSSIMQTYRSKKRYKGLDSNTLQSFPQPPNWACWMGEKQLSRPESIPQGTLPSLQA